MFKNATIFNQGISSWCLEQISTEPTEFSLNFALQDSFKRYCGANCTMGITELLAANFKIFPNPTRDVLYIENSSQSTIYKLTVLIITGKVVLVKNVTDQEQIKIDLTELSSENYLFELQTSDNQKIVRRIVKKLVFVPIYFF